MIDVWEHAYYPQYKNVKADYVNAIWNLVNWADVSRRFDAAKSFVPSPPDKRTRPLGSCNRAASTCSPSPGRGYWM